MDGRMDGSSAQTTNGIITLEGRSHREVKNDEPHLHLFKPKEYAIPAFPAPPSPPLLLPSSDEGEIKQTLDKNTDTHREHGAMRRLSITRGHPD